MIIACYLDGSILVWDPMSTILYDSNPNKQLVSTVVYSHLNYGDIIIFGDVEGNIKFTNFNEQKNKPTFDIIK